MLKLNLTQSFLQLVLVTVFGLIEIFAQNQSNTFLYQDWLDKGIVYISDLLHPPHPGSKLFEELILDYDISRKDRRKYNFLMRNIPNEWLASDLTPDTIFVEISTKLLTIQKIPKYAYGIILDSCVPEKTNYILE